MTHVQTRRRALAERWATAKAAARAHAVQRVAARAAEPC